VDAPAGPGSEPADGSFEIKAAAEIPDGGFRRFTVGNRQVLLFRLGDSYFAVRANCPHRAAPLDRGRLEGALVRCPWHGIKFDVRTGARVCAPVCEDLETYPTQVRDGRVWIRVPSKES
jgi:nitrite reductase/ring-hydroxylating ferredoxin subunit